MAKKSKKASKKKEAHVKAQKENKFTVSGRKAHGWKVLLVRNVPNLTHSLLGKALSYGICTITCTKTKKIK